MPLTPERKAAVTERPRLQRLVISAYRVIGDRAVAYLLNVTPKKAAEYLLLGNWPKAEPELLELIGNLLKPAESGEEPLSVRLHQIGRSFVGYMSEYDTSICNAIRLASGGTLPDTEHEDPVAGPLRRLARDVGPLFLLFEATDALAQAAAEAGFADQSHMTRQFKRTYGLTPARWTALTAASSPA